MRRDRGSRVKPLTKAVREIVALDTPQKPAHIKEGFQIALEDLPRYKEPIVSPKMQKSLRILDLRIDPEGFLYSPKSYNPEWEWQSQAVWLRTVGIRPITISKRLNKSINSIKSMFKRLKALTPFYRGVSNDDWANIGRNWVGDKGSVKVREINFGGVADQNRSVGGDIDEISDMRGSIGYDNDLVNIDQRSGEIYEKVGNTSGGINNRFTYRKPPEYTEFDLEEHNKHHEPSTDPVKALDQIIISLDAYEEQERQLLEHEKRRDALHNEGKHTPRSPNAPKKIGGGGYDYKGVFPRALQRTENKLDKGGGHNFGRRRISVEEKVAELSNWVDYGGN